MKKIIAVLLIGASIMGLSACGPSTLKNEWLLEEVLETCAVPDLPEISDKDYYYHYSNPSTGVLNLNRIEFKATDEEIREYARTVYAYLAAQDFTYLGTRGAQKSSLAGALATYYFKDVHSFGECYEPNYAKNYIFVYSNDQDASDGIMFHEILITAFDAKTIRYDGKAIRVNAEISIKYDESYALKDSERTYPSDELALGYWFFHSGIIDGKEVIIYDKYDNGLIVTPTEYSSMLFNNDYTGEYEWKGTTKSFTWTKLDDSNIQVIFSDDTIGTATFISDDRMRFTYGDLIMIYDDN